MYHDYFGLQEKPFSITPNPRFIFLSANHREVFAHLLYGIRQHAGFIEVTGEVGTGKTTVLRTLFSQLEAEGCRIAYIFNPALTAIELLRTINREFGLPYEELSAAALHGTLNAFLLAENRSSRTVVLVVDEAQNLDVAVLEQIRLLSNLETDSDKLIQIILVGQPELGQLLSRRELRQLSQRITVRYHLKAMNFSDSCSYIEHRLRVAGHSGRPIFTAAALRKIFQRTRGNPRLINVLCDRALLVAFTRQADQVTPQLIAAAERELRRVAPSGWQRWMWPAAAAAAVLLGLVLFERAPWAVPPEQPTGASAVVPPAPVIDSLPNIPHGEQALLTAFSALLQRWSGNIAFPTTHSIDEWLDAARQQGFETIRYQGDLEPLLRLDLPFIADFSLNAPSASLAAVIGRQGETLMLAMPAGTTSVPVAALQRLWPRRAYLVWRNPLRIPVDVGMPRDSAGMVQLQTLLIEAGATHVTLSGRNDTATTNDLRTIQQQEGMTADGLIGPQTLMALYRLSGRHGYPRLNQEEPGP